MQAATPFLPRLARRADPRHRRALFSAAPASAPPRGHALRARRPHRESPYTRPRPGALPAPPAHKKRSAPLGRGSLVRRWARIARPTRGVRCVANCMAMVAVLARSGRAQHGHENHATLKFNVADTDKRTNAMRTRRYHTRGSGEFAQREGPVGASSDLMAATWVTRLNQPRILAATYRDRSKGRLSCRKSSTPTFCR